MGDDALLTSSNNTVQKQNDVAPEQGTKAPNPWKFRLRLLIALILPVFLETLDYTIVATAQPHIASQFNRLDLQGWIGTTYLLTSTVFLPLYGSFTDIFGRHWALQSSLVWFMIGSALSTGAQNMPMMLAGRGIAGVGAAGFLSVVRIILADARSLDENTFQSSMMIVLYSIGYSVGPVIGGALTSVTFRWVFGINLPCSALAMVLVFLLLRGRVKGPQPSSRQRAREHDPSHKYTWVDKLLTIDFVAAFLFISGGILILLGLNWGSTTVWKSARVIASLTIGGLLIIACLLWENLIEYYDDPARHKALPGPLEAEPMLPIPIFRNWDTVICQYTAFTSGMVMLVAFYFVAIFFTIVSGQDATKAGIQLIYFAPGVGGGVLISTRLIKILRQPKWPIIFGTIIIPVAIGLISHAIAINNQGQVNGFMALAGVGTGMTFAPIGIHARFSQPVNRVAVVESLQLFFRTLGGTVGLAQCSTVMNSKVKSAIVDLVRSGVINSSDLPQGAQSSSVTSITQINSLPGPVADAIREAYRNGTRWAFISLIPWTGLACIAVLFLSQIEDPDRLVVKDEKNTSSPQEASDVEKETKDISSASNQHIPNVPKGAKPLGEKPTTRGVIGPIGYIIYLIKKALWERRRRNLEKRGELDPAAATA